ncbi:MAG: DsrE family protein [Nitrospiraceae bacterium]
MKKLAVIVTRGSYNNLLQVCELIRIAATAGTQVSVLFRDEAALKVTNEKVKELTFSEGYRGREARLREILRDRSQHELQAILRDIKEKGDVKFSVCRDSVEWFELRVEQLIAELDEVQSADAFWKEEVAQADQVLTF